MTVVLVPGASTSSGAFDAFGRALSRDLDPSLGTVRVVELPAGDIVTEEVLDWLANALPTHDAEMARNHR